ncbi:equilibrative nucleoside transporter 3 [Takifugu flavidus]|uniref:Equilibrative nucleoside transporter 3 n=1 Tax=Takifugu flavidus TaxID=433684 RepID=A0A5C6PHA6_9TELE|nr:equilibrative nucleoside transporter 3 [Takifugu flavidus]XP_056904361.1 equilibrative nucleoside transporter 3 [Takifugu flavidus]TWW78715.1 Equilibrative nucleoside transporter 3 [Takifugu flavidus]
MDSTAAGQPSLNSSYLPNAHGDDQVSADEESEDQTPSASLLPKHSPGPLAVQYIPEDSYFLVYIIFFLMGIGSLLPWNFFITAKQYWLYKLSNNSHDGDAEQLSDLSDYFESYLSIASTVPSVLCLILNYFLVNRLSPNVRILSSLFIILVVFVATTVLVEVDVSGCRLEFLVATLACVAVVSGASNIFSGSMFGISGHFPMRISQALISGQAMGGTLSAVASVVDLAVANDVTSSALVYFLTADIFILLCIASYLLLPKLAYSRHYILAARCTSPGVMSEGGTAAGSTTRSGVPPLQPILRKTWVLGLSVFYVFCVSIMVFPAVSSGIQSVQKGDGSPWTTTYFVPLTSFLMYNIADFCGRQATAWLQVPGPTSRVLPLLVLCRSIMVPLLMLCNYQPRVHLRTVFFTHDVYPVIFNCLLGLSNGYLGTLPMIYGPKVVPRELAEATGVVMSFFLTLGLAVGSAFSVLIVHCI